MTDRVVEAARIVKAFDVSEEVMTSSIACRVDLVVDALDFGSVKDALHRALSRQFVLRLMDGSHVLKQSSVLSSPEALQAITPCIVSAGRDPQHATHHTNRPYSPVRNDEPECHRKDKAGKCYYRQRRALSQLSRYQR